MRDDGLWHQWQNAIEQSEAGTQDGHAHDGSCELCAAGLCERRLHAGLLQRQFPSGFQKEHACEHVDVTPKLMRRRADRSDGREMALRQRMLNNDRLHEPYCVAFACAGKVFHHRIDVRDTMQA